MIEAMEDLNKVVKSYEAWVSRNPDVVGDFETTAKWVSYFIAGRVSDSNIVSELIYSLSNMLVLYNDRIIDRARGATAHEITKAKGNGMCYRLKVVLTTLEYSEVFIEISAKRALGRTGRWLVVVFIQLFKAASRLFILKHSTSQFITSPAIPSLNRRALIKQLKNNDGVLPKIMETSAEQLQMEHSISVKLKRSGRLIRKVEGAPPIQYRDFKLQADVAETQKAQIPKALLQAEYLYIAKPLLHLAAIGIFGEKNWKQYALALSLDLVSIRMHHKHRYIMTNQQKLELSRRSINLLLYLMRTPFYESFTKSRLERVLDFIANNVPIARMVATPLREYIPHWQRTYFYLWST